MLDHTQRIKVHVVMRLLMSSKQDRKRQKYKQREKENDKHV